MNGTIYLYVLKNIKWYFKLKNKNIIFLVNFSYYLLNFCTIC